MRLHYIIRNNLNHFYTYFYLFNHLCCYREGCLLCCQHSLPLTLEAGVDGAGKPAQGLMEEMAFVE